MSKLTYIILSCVFFTLLIMLTTTEIRKRGKRMAALEHEIAGLNDTVTFLRAVRQPGSEADNEQPCLSSYKDSVLIADLRQREKAGMQMQVLLAGERNALNARLEQLKAENILLKERNTTLGNSLNTFIREMTALKNKNAVDSARIITLTKDTVRLWNRVEFFKEEMIKSEQRNKVLPISPK